MDLVRTAMDSVELSAIGDPPRGFHGERHGRVRCPRPHRHLVRGVRGRPARALTTVVTAAQSPLLPPFTRRGAGGPNPEGRLILHQAAGLDSGEALEAADHEAQHGADTDHAQRQPAAPAGPARPDEGASQRRAGTTSAPMTSGCARPCDAIVRQQAEQRHRRRDRRRAEQDRLLQLRERAPRRLRAAPQRDVHGSFAAEVAAFPEYYEQYFGRAMTGGRRRAARCRWSARGR